MITGGGGGGGGIPRLRDEIKISPPIRPCSGAAPVQVYLLLPDCISDFITAGERLPQVYQRNTNVSSRLPLRLMGSTVNNARNETPRKCNLAASFVIVGRRATSVLIPDAPVARSRWDSFNGKEKKKSPRPEFH